MRAAEYDRYGPTSVLVVRDVPRPRPRPGELLVRVRAAALNPKDVLARSGRFRLLSVGRFPRRVGFDWSGEVAEVGAGVEGVPLGAAYFGMLGGFRGGACAEYLAVRPSGCAPGPAGIGHVEAASAPLAASTALQALRDLARLGPGMRLLVNGASGGVGTFAIQVAKLLGAHVTTASSARNLELCRRLGADVALDYRATDPLSAPERFDVVLDLFGNRTAAEARRVLPRHGVFVTAVPRIGAFLEVARSRLSPPRAELVVVRPRAADLRLIAGWLAGGKLVPVVERTYPLEQIAEAEAHVETKRTRGKVVVTPD